jgi:hypothetical protein
MRWQPNELSLRRERIGGGLTGSLRQLPAGLLSRARRVLLLIHGYNATLCEAGCAFSGFKRFLPAVWFLRSAALYWPGDAAAPLGRPDARRPRGQITRVLSSATYTFQISTAESAAQILSRAIQARPPEKRALQLDVVAHSLGCRLALELLESLAGLPIVARPRIRLTALLGAAVPRFTAMPGGKLHRGAASADRLLVFHSRADPILRFAFPFGQLLEGGFLDRLRPNARTAIGRSGCGPGLPNARNFPQDSFGHSDYWPSEGVALRIAETLDRNRPLSSLARTGLSGRVIGETHLPEARDPDRLLRRLRVRRLPLDGAQFGLCRDCPPCPAHSTAR